MAIDQEHKRAYTKAWHAAHPNYKREWEAANRERINAKQNKRNRDLKGRVVSHYTNGLNECARCGFNDIRALELHHTNGGGDQDRARRNVTQSTQFYRSVELDGFPHGLEVLCANCHAIEHAVKEQTREQWLFKAREYVRLSEGLKTD